MNTPLVLVILDGWGIGVDEPGNAVLAADTPVMDRLMHLYPHTQLITSGEAVGLPEGQMGNSEVGHLNLGAGFVVYQWITRIDRAIADGSFHSAAAFQHAFETVRERNSTLHLIGLIGYGGVHAHSRHLYALLDATRDAGMHKVLVHAVTDGRDTPPDSAGSFLAELEQVLIEKQIGRIASVSGRYYAMDRDNRWERVQKAFDAIARGIGPTASSAEEVVRSSQAIEVTDEFVVPTVIVDSTGLSHEIGPDDAVIFFNFRSDRGRELTHSLASPEVSELDRGEYQPPALMVTMTTYDKELPVEVAFAPQDVELPVAKVISDAGMKQLHTAETEKYPHVTFFFNGGREVPFSGEARNLVPSPKVATYDMQPEMSAFAVCEDVVQAIQDDSFDFILVNFANPDMVGHTGVFNAVVQAVQTTDVCLGRIIDALRRAGGVAIVTADHGNAERTIDPETGGPMTSHTTNPVPLALFAPDDSPLRHVKLRAGAVLSSVGTTVIDLLGLPVPESMTSPSLLQTEDIQS